MKIALKQLEELKGAPHFFEEEIEVEDHLRQRDAAILAVSPAKISGMLLYQNGSVLAHFTCHVTVTLPSSRSLEPVDVLLEIPIEERYIVSNNLDILANGEEESEIILPLDGDWVDLQAAVEDHILLSIPLKVLSKEEEKAMDMPSGTDWVLVSEEQYLKQKQEEKEQTIDPRLASLQNFFDAEDE